MGHGLLQLAFVGEKVDATHREVPPRPSSAEKGMKSDGIDYIGVGLEDVRALENRVHQVVDVPKAELNVSSPTSWSMLACHLTW